MNILFINTIDDKGGAARMTYKLKTGLEKNGITTSMFVKHKSLPDKNIFEVARPNMFTKKLGAFSKKLTGRDIPAYLQYITRIALSDDMHFFNNTNLLDSQEFKDADIIHCHNLHGNYFNLTSLQKISKMKPVVWTQEDMWPITPHEAWIVKDETGAEKFSMEVTPHLKWNSRWFLFKAKQHIYAHSDLHIVAACQWSMDELENSILRDKKRYLIHHGVDETVFTPHDKIESRKKLGLPIDKKIITFMANGGKNNEQKGWPYAAEVIRNYRDRSDVLFLCIGGNEKASDATSGNIQYVPYLADEMSVSLHYSASDIFLNPSLAENFGLIIAQVMACGTPIVTFPVGIANEAIQHKKTGYIANYQDAQDLARGITYVLGLSEHAIEEIRKATRQTVVENYTLDIMLKKHIQLYEKLLQAKK